MTEHFSITKRILFARLPMLLQVSLSAAAVGMIGCTVVGFDTPYNKGIEAYRAGDLGEAVEQFTIAVRKDPEFHEAWYNLARVYDERAEHVRVRAEEREAEGATLEAEELFEFHADQLAKAEHAYEQAIRHAPHSARAHISYGMFLYERGDTAGARERLEFATEVETDRAIALTALGHFYQLEGEWERAREFYVRALDREPEHALTHYRLGTWFAEQRRFAEARDAYREVIQLNREDEMAWLRIGYVYGELGEPARAANALDRYLTLTTPSPGTNRHRAEILLDIAEFCIAAGRYEAAVEALWSARLHAPHNATISEMLQQVYTQLIHEEEVRRQGLSTE